MEDLKSEMRQTIAMQLDTFWIQQKKRKLRRLWPSFVPDVQGSILRMSFHCNQWRYVSFVRKTTPQTSAQPYPDLKPCTKGLKGPLSHSTSLTKGGHMDPDLTSRGCKEHPKLITTPTNPLTCLLGASCSSFLVRTSSLVLSISIPYSTC